MHRDFANISSVKKVHIFCNILMTFFKAIDSALIFFFLAASSAALIVFNNGAVVTVRLEFKRRSTNGDKNQHCTLKCVRWREKGN